MATLQRQQESLICSAAAREGRYMLRKEKRLGDNSNHLLHQHHRTQTQIDSKKHVNKVSWTAFSQIVKDNIPCYELF